MRKEDERMSLFSDVGHNAFEERLELLVFSMIPAEVPYRKVASFYFMPVLRVPLLCLQLFKYMVGKALIVSVNFLRDS